MQDPSLPPGCTQADIDRAYGDCPEWASDFQHAVQDILRRLEAERAKLKALVETHAASMFSATDLDEMLNLAIGDIKAAVDDGALRSALAAQEVADEDGRAEAAAARWEAMLDDA